MMKLSQASTYFDRTPATVPETGKVLFMGQIDPFDDARRDSGAAYRRILSVKPGTVIPASRVVKMLGAVWIVGGMEPDGLSELHREKYVIQKADGLLSVSRLSGFLSGTAASVLWSSPQWVKSAKELEVSSGMPQVYDVTLPSGSDVRDRDILWDSGHAYLAMARHDQASDLMTVTCMALDQVLPLVATVSTRTYSATLGAYGAPVDVAVNALAVRWQSLFQYGSEASSRYQEGDVSIVLPAGTAVSTSTLVTLAGAVYQTLACLDLAGAVVLHSRAV